MREPALHVRSWGPIDASPVLLVHGSVMDGEECWRHQRPLSERGFRLNVPDRRGFGSSPSVDRVDFDSDAEDIANLLEPGVHLVGWSYGGVVALLAASRGLETIASLTVVEPSAFALARGQPAVEEFVAGMEAMSAWAERDPRSARDAFSSLGADAQRFLLERPPWEADIPIATLRSAPFPKLVLSGGASPVFEATCDAVASAIGARRDRVPAKDHAVQHVETPFNQRLELFLRSGR